MKSLLLVPLLALSSFALAGEVNIGVGGGIVAMDDLEVLGSTWTVVPRVGYFFDDNVGVELDVGFMKGKTRIGDFDYTGVTPRLNFIGRLWKSGKRAADGSYSKPPPIQPILAMGIGAFYKGTDDNGALGHEYISQDIDFMVNAGPGLRIPIGPLHLRTDLRWLLNLGSESFRNHGDQFIDWEWTAGIGLNFGGKPDKDHDGILDKDDECKDEAEDLDQFEDEDGCPDPDNDGDGIIDADDQAPNEAEDLDGFEDGDGKPDLDNDGDGFPDTEDACPDIEGVESAKGCPDQDTDTVADALDECIEEAGLASAFGCFDDDKDGVPNYRDQCPDEPVHADVDPRFSDGCPSKVFVTATSIRILEKVQFDTGEATIKEVSHQLLTEVSKTLHQYPHIKKVSVEGHTDNTGEPDANMALSEARAKAVVEHLIGLDIDAGRMEPKGFGQTKPLDPATADTEDGRTANRRVEFNITEMDEKVEIQKRGSLTLEKVEDISLDGLTVKEAFLPAKDSFTGEAMCKVTVAIGEEGGKPTGITVRECVRMPRSIARRTFQAWSFEPTEIKKKATAVTADFTLEFKEGVAKLELENKSVKPVEE